jgi:hypothetical protein
VLASAAILAAQLGTWTLAERGYAIERLTASECAANVLEAARATPWADLTPAWAAGRKLPADVTGRLNAAALTVRVEPEADRPRVKRVTVELHWKPRTGPKEQTVTLVGLFADRSAGGEK